MNLLVQEQISFDISGSLGLLVKLLSCKKSVVVAVGLINVSMNELDESAAESKQLTSFKHLADTVSPCIELINLLVGINDLFSIILVASPVSYECLPLNDY